jgi:hypothetical protein
LSSAKQPLPRGLSVKYFFAECHALGKLRPLAKVASLRVASSHLLLVFAEHLAVWHSIKIVLFSFLKNILPSAL